MSIAPVQQTVSGARLYVETEYPDNRSMKLVARDERGIPLTTITFYRLPPEQVDLLRLLPKDKDYAFYQAHGQYVTDHELADHLYGCYRWGVCGACEGSGEGQRGDGCHACNGLGHRPPGAPQASTKVVDCPDCDGTEPCERCTGSGLLEVPQGDPPAGETLSQWHARVIGPYEDAEPPQGAWGPFSEIKVRGETVLELPWSKWIRRKPSEVA